MYLANGIVCVSLNLFFFNRGQLLYNVVLVSAIQQCVSVITVYICIFPLEPCSHPQPCLCPFKHCSPTFLAPGMGFMENNFFMGQRNRDGFEMSQAHYIYCALYFCYYYTSSTSDQQALDSRGLGPLLLNITPESSASHTSLSPALKIKTILRNLYIVEFKALWESCPHKISSANTQNSPSQIYDFLIITALSLSHTYTYKTLHRHFVKM